MELWRLGMRIRDYETIMHITVHCENKGRLANDTAKLLGESLGDNIAKPIQPQLRD